jgi:tetratricopeptide (TPR) repeat protein
MAEKVRYTRKDLKGPDEFISTFGRTVAWAKENRTRVAAAVLGAVALVAVVLGARAYSRWEENRSSRDLWPHLNSARELLQTPAAATPEKLASLEQFLLAHVNRHPKTAATVYARHYLGAIAFLRGEYDRAVEQYRAGIATGKAVGVAEYLLRDGVARSLEAKGDYPGAAAAHREAAGFAQADMKDQSLLGEARCLALSGKKAEAAALYRKILQDHPESKARNLIEIQLAQME